MDQPFIYKYRPQTLNAFEIDPKIIELLQTLIKLDNLNLLLVGDSGCGKTALVNCIIKEYYGSEFNSINILTINSLKDQGIAYYRSEVKTFCQTMCTIPNKKKIVVLDDIDNINEQSQQVFRNCIDKYSNNVNFIAACSNTQRVIDSFQSRVIMLKIKALEKVHLERIITKICESESLIIDKSAREFILSICNNSVRIIINYLEKFKLLDTIITYDIAISTCTNISFKELKIYTELCKNSKYLGNAIKLIYSIYDRGYSVIDILDTYFLFIKTTDLIDEKIKYAIITLLCKYITIFFNVHEEEVELALFTNDLVNILHTKFIL
jgi:DNA polymerase III delta prime subunit